MKSLSTVRGFLRAFGCCALVAFGGGCGTEGVEPEPLPGNAGWVCGEALDLASWESVPPRSAGEPARFRDPRTGLVFVAVEPGEFTMGGPAIFEQPKHRVKITRALLVAETETTIAQWEAFLVARGGQPRRLVESAEAGEFPVIDVSHTDVRLFCDAYGYRLPTEAEWEYVCRGGVPNPEIVQADAQIEPFGWFYTNSQNGEIDGGGAHPVASALPNGLGLYDTLGNVWEWCADNYQDSYPGRDLAGVNVDPKGPVEGARRVIRGGSWYSVPTPRASDRGFALPDQRSPLIGFRVVVNGKVPPPDTK